MDCGHDYTVQLDALLLTRASVPIVTLMMQIKTLSLRSASQLDGMTTIVHLHSQTAGAITMSLMQNCADHGQGSHAFSTELVNTWMHILQGYRQFMMHRCLSRDRCDLTLPMSRFIQSLPIASSSRYIRISWLQPLQGGRDCQLEQIPSQASPVWS